MSVKLRLRRGGKKKHPIYRIVAIDSRTRRDGEYIEKVGFYDPNPDPAIITVDREKALKWLGMGAIPSDTVRSFLKRDGIMYEHSLRKQGLDDDRVAEEMKKWEVIQLEKQKKAEAKAAMAKREEEKKAKKAEAEPEKAVESEAPEEAVETATEEPETATEEPEAAAEKPAEETAPAAEEAPQEEAEAKPDTSKEEK